MPLRSLPSALAPARQVAASGRSVTTCLGSSTRSSRNFTSYAELSKAAVAALQASAGEVRSGKFPDAEDACSPKAEEIDKPQSMLAGRSKSERAAG